MAILNTQSRKKELPPAQQRAKDFLDMTVPGILKFYPDHYISGSTYRCVWALREYPTTTDEKALLRHLGEKGNVTLHIYSRDVNAAEERRIIQNAANKHKMDSTSSSDISQAIGAEANLQDVAALVRTLRDNREPLLYCAVYIELVARDMDELKLLQTEVYAELTRSKLNVDKLLLRQQQGFLSVMPGGANQFGEQFERALPASSVANTYPFNYSGKTDTQGFYIGRDRFGSNIIVDLDKREDDKTNGNCLILGNSGQGKSYLLKLLVCNLLESGKSVVCLDPEQELAELCESLGGCFADLMNGRFKINPLQPKTWDDGGEAGDEDLPSTFHQKTRLSQHISFLKDLFRAYKDFSDKEIDVIEMLLAKLYARWGINDTTDFAALSAVDYPILSDLYDLGEAEFRAAEQDPNKLYTTDTLRDILLGLHSMCKGSDAVMFNGHTNIGTGRFVVFGVKSLLQASRNVKDTMLFNVLSHMSDQLLTEGNAVAAIDELYIFLSQSTTIIEYIRGLMKRARKRDSMVILSSQNLEDFDVSGIRELTKPLFSIPTHVFLFNAGNIDARFYMDTLQVEESEFKLIQYPQRGACLYKCGTERYNLLVHAPEHKARLFGKVGGR